MAIQGYQASMVSALRLQDRFTELTRQVSSGGQRAESYAGLGRDAAAVLINRRDEAEAALRHADGPAHASPPARTGRWCGAGREAASPGASGGAEVP